MTVKKSSNWEPLKRPLFRDRWLASIVSNVGGWMQDTAGTWLMTTLTVSPLLIALMQTAASLPVLLLGLPAGATADIFDRRRLLIFWQTWMLVAVAILSVLTLAHLISPWTLLILTFLMNIGSAMNNPAWQAIVPELVPRDEIPNAIALNSAGYNLTRAVGPALGGLAVAAFASVTRGAGTVFLFNSLSFIAVIYVLFRWKRTPLFKSAFPAERISGSMRVGLRYVLHAPALRSVLARAFLFTLFVSAIWALLAVVAQRDLHQGAMGYGILTASMGVGAVAGAAALPSLRKRYSPNRIVAVTPLIILVTLLVLATVRSVPAIVLALLAAGFAWTSTTSSFNVSIQLSAPAWVQARTLGIYQMVFQGGMALGSALWGYIAEHSTASIALVAAAAGLAATLPLALRFKLLHGAPPDLTSYGTSRPALELAIEPDPEDGPVLVTIEYRIRPADYDAFIHVIHALKRVRLRDGAMRWGIYQSMADPELLTETFLVESWIEYLRQRERMTRADRELLEQAVSYHQGDKRPIPHRMIYARETAEGERKQENGSSATNKPRS